MEIKVGYARVDITPQESVPLAGLGNTLNRMSDNILDPLQGTCIAFTDESGSTVLTYTSDLINSLPPLLDRVRAVIEQKHGIPGRCVMFAGTHTHSATDNRKWDTHPAVAKATDVMVERMIEAAGLALADRKCAKLFVGRSNPKGLNFIRHYIRDPETRELIGHPYEPDNQLQMVKIAREEGKDILIMNWQAHPCFTSGYTKHDVSADYIHSIREKVEQETDCLFAFFLGGSGDVNTRSRIKSEIIAQDREVYAQMMFDYIRIALENMESVPTGAVRVGQKVLTLENDHSDDHRVDDARIVAKYWAETYDRKATDAMAKQYGINSPYHANAIISRSQKDATTQMAIHAVSIGGLGFAFAPYEMFCRNGMYIKENAPKDVTIVATCANDSFSYIADDFAFTEQCYEVDMRKFPRGTAEKVADAFVELLKELNG